MKNEISTKEEPTAGELGISGPAQVDMEVRAGPEGSRLYARRIVKPCFVCGDLFASYCESDEACGDCEDDALDALDFIASSTCAKCGDPECDGDHGEAEISDSNLG